MEWLLRITGVTFKPLNVPFGLTNLPPGFEAHQGPSTHPSCQLRSLRTARRRWGEADLMVSLPDGRYRLAD